VPLRSFARKAASLRARQGLLEIPQLNLSARAEGGALAGRLALYAVAAALLVWVAARGWISDDAAITVRCVENLLDGHGWRWNVSERVQAFTHPLWALLLVPVMASGIPWFAALPSLGLAATAIVLWQLLRTARSVPAAFFALSALAASRAFIDFSTSGLENPLANALLVTLVAQVPSDGRVDAARVGRASLLVSLLALTRLDLLVLGLPVLLHLGLAARKRDAGRVLYAVLLGLSPLVVWEVFSIVYYGFPFPNTAYAKLNTGVDRLTYLGLGLRYFEFTLAQDPWTLLAPALALASAIRWRASRAAFAFVGAVALHYMYVVWIGGDFMGGRFFVAPLVLSVALCASRHVRLSDDDTGGLRLSLGALTLALLCFARPLRGLVPAADGVFDERSHNVESTGLASLLRAGKAGPDNTWLRRGAQYRRAAAEAHSGEKGVPIRVEHAHAIGMLGLAAGPRVHIVDHLALADPFLARLPAAFDPKIQIGHFERMGQWSAPVSVVQRCPLNFEVCRFWRDYTRTLQTGVCVLEDPALCRYWDALRSVTRGELFSKERWLNILRLNTGQLDSLVDQDRYRNAVRAYPAVAH
jgi:arabinofuranosyltransferase